MSAIVTCPLPSKIVYGPARQKVLATIISKTNGVKQADII